MEYAALICEGAGSISVLSGDGVTGWRRHPISTEGLWPCWAPDGEIFALSTLNPGRRDVRGAIDLLDVSGRYLREAHGSIAGAPPVIAPRVPHYVNWSPDATTISFVAPGTDALGLYLSDRSGSYNSDRIATGAPLFHAWSPDASYIAIHAGADLSLFTLGNRRTVHVSGNAVGFRTPVFFEGRLVYARPEPPGVAVVACYPTNPGQEVELGRFSGGVVLESVPGNEPALSVAVTTTPDTGSFDELWIIEPEGGPGRLAPGPFAGATWSPDGRYVALFVPTQAGDGRYAIQVLDRAGRYVAATEGFVPSQDMRTFLAFFDQYLLSHRLWAPDASAMLVSGRLAGDAVAWSFADRQTDYAWYWPVAKQSPLQLLGPGDFASFRP